MGINNGVTYGDINSSGFSDEDLTNETDMSLLMGEQQEEQSEEEQSNQEQNEDGNQSEEESSDNQEEEQSEEEQSDEEESSEEEKKDEEQQSDEKKEDDSSKHGSKMVPAARLSKATQERNALKEERNTLKDQIEQLKAQLAEKTAQTVTAQTQNGDEEAIDIDEKEAAYAEALLVGDTATAKAIRKEINAALKQEITREQESRYVQKEQSNVFMNTVKQIEQRFPFLDPKSADVDEGAIKDVLAFRDMYISKGHTASEAIILATERVAPLYMKPAATAKTVTNNGERSKESLKKSADTATKIPPRSSSAGVGNKMNGSAIDVHKLSIEEYEKLSDAQRRRLLGG